MCAISSGGKPVGPRCHGPEAAPAPDSTAGRFFASCDRPRSFTAAGADVGGNNAHQVFVGGITGHQPKDGDIAGPLAERVEEKGAAVEAAKREETAALEPAE